MLAPYRLQEIVQQVLAHGASGHPFANAPTQASTNASRPPLKQAHCAPTIPVVYAVCASGTSFAAAPTMVGTQNLKRLVTVLSDTWSLPATAKDVPDRGPPASWHRFGSRQVANDAREDDANDETEDVRPRERAANNALDFEAFGPGFL